MKKQWKIGMTILILAIAIAILSTLLKGGFSTTIAGKDDKPISNASPETTKSRPQRIPAFIRKMMEEEGMNSQDLRNNPELRKRRQLNIALYRH